MAFGKPKAPKEPKPPKAPKEKKPKKPKKEKPPKAKKGKKGQTAPEEPIEGQEGQEGEEQQPKKKKPIILLLIPIVVIVAAAAIIFFVVLPKINGEADVDPEPSVSLEPLPPELPSQIPIGDDVNIKGMTLGSDESEALVEKSKRVTYTYSNLVDAGKAAETYVGQLASESPSFSIVDEEFVRQTDKPDYTAAEGMVLLARNVAVKAPEATAAPEEEASVEPAESVDPEASAEPTPTPTPEPDPEPTPEPVTYVHTVRITWSPGVCVVTADEEEGKVTSPARPSAQHSVSQRGARMCLEGMNPAELGLPGESMDQYEVLPMDGTEMVDGVPAIRVHVYNDDNVAGSNDIMGIYLMTIDGEHLYKLDLDSNEIEELDFEYNP